MTGHPSRFFTTAGITFEVQSEYLITDDTFHPNLRLFQTDDPGQDRIVISHFFNIPARLKKLKDEDAVCELSVWTIFREGKTWLYKKKQADYLKEDSVAFIEFEDDLRCCRVYSDCLNQNEYSQGRFRTLTLFRFDQLIITGLLAEQQGMLLHSNSFIHRGAGRLLSGPSGAGKSTLTGMLEKKGFNVTSDDRMIVKFEDQKMMMYGSWLHGTTPIVSDVVHPVDTVFFLEQALKNEIIPMDKNEQKIGALLQAVIRPYTGGNKSCSMLLHTVEKMINHVKCYLVKFDLSGKIVDKIESLNTDELNS